VFTTSHDPAGLHEGLRSLIAGGVPPGFLIIDDGWQCTDVDEPLRQPKEPAMLKQLHMPEAEETSDEFIEAELEMLAMGAKDIPQGTALGERLPRFHYLSNGRKQLHMLEDKETSDKFIEAELEMLAMGAKDIPQGTALCELL
jgi:hypothetical protein